jgi:antitoxin FitA
MSITIDISDDQYTELSRLATATNSSVEEFVRREVAALIDRKRSFQSAANYVLEKNAELYRRLAK